MFPNHNQLPNPENPLFSEMRAKEIGFSPFVMCDFYQGFDVLQVEGVESGEYFFGNYFQGKYCGAIYLGDVFKPLEVAKYSTLFMPPTLDLLQEYAQKNRAEVNYYRCLQSHYAFVMEKVIKKIPS